MKPAFALLSVLLSANAAGAVFTVGTGSGCTHNSLQSAISAASSNGIDDTIRVTRSLSYTAQALTVGNFQTLEITGGFATCDQSANDGSYTTIDGTGGASEPVFRVTHSSTNSTLQLRYLTIRGGDEDGQGYGGGIYYRGQGLLSIRDSNITSNTAGYGGGIYAEGTTIDTRLLISSNVQISLNTARYSGGGVYVDGARMYMFSPSSWIGFNKALGVANAVTGGIDGGYGGGLMILSGGLAARAEVSSSGLGSGGPIYFNEARYGGGVSIIAHEQDASLYLFTSDATAPVRIRSNTASVFGGAVFMQHGGVSGDFGSAVLKAQYAFLEDNTAPNGAALYLDGEGAGVPRNIVKFNVDDLTSLGALPCPNNLPCGGINGNFAQDEFNTARGGVIEAQNFSELRFERILMNGNSGRNLLRGDGDESGRLTFDTHHVAMIGNAVTGHLLTTDNDDSDFGAITLNDTTIAGNVIGENSVLNISNASTASGGLFRSIIWQPGRTTLTLSGQPLGYLTNIASEVGSLNAGPEAIASDPRFIDPARSDYQLRAASPAVDYATTVPSDPVDLLNRPRDRDLEVVADVRGPRDLGAWERTDVLPLVLNGNFDADSNLWPPTTAGVSSWDSTQNAAGPSGSGAIKVTQAGTPNLQRVYGLNQCIHLPGPGVYALNGWGRAGAGGVGNRDYLYLNWELRHDGGEGCSSGPADASGDHFLSNSSNWQHPVNPKLIQISDDDWTSNSSLFITQVVAEFGVTNPPTTIGWFDGITVELEMGDTIFEDGFEPAL